MDFGPGAYAFYTDLDELEGDSLLSDVTDPFYNTSYIYTAGCDEGEGWNKTGALFCLGDRTPALYSATYYGVSGCERSSWLPKDFSVTVAVYS